jgi:hypothetical protein
MDKSPHASDFVTGNGLRLHYLDWGGSALCNDSASRSPDEYGQPFNHCECHEVETNPFNDAISFHEF